MFSFLWWPVMDNCFSAIIFPRWWWWVCLRPIKSWEFGVKVLPLGCRLRLKRLEGLVNMLDFDLAVGDSPGAVPGLVYVPPYVFLRPERMTFGSSLTLPRPLQPQQLVGVEPLSSMRTADASIFWHCHRALSNAREIQP